MSFTEDFDVFPHTTSLPLYSHLEIGLLCVSISLTPYSHLENGLFCAFNQFPVPAYSTGGQDDLVVLELLNTGLEQQSAVLLQLLVAHAVFVRFSATLLKELLEDGNIFGVRLAVLSDQMMKSHILVGK